jgi:hypothetical protein
LASIEPVPVTLSNHASVSKTTPWTVNYSQMAVLRTYKPERTRRAMSCSWVVRISNPTAITKEQWCNLHHYFIDISSGNRENLVSVLDEPVERARFLETLHHHGPFQPLGCPSVFGEARDRMEAVLEKLTAKNNLTPEELSSLHLI